MSPDSHRSDKSLVGELERLAELQEPGALTDDFPEEQSKGPSGQHSWEGMNVGDWLQGIATSVVGGVVLLIFLAVVGAVFSRQARWVLNGALGRLLGIELDKVYESSAMAQPDLTYDMRRARTVAIFTGRGDELQREAFKPLFAGRPEHRSVRVRVLLPATNTGARVDWVKQREIELGRFDASFGHGLLRRQIGSNVEFLRGYQGRNVEVRRYSMPHLGRLVITERAAYLAFYRADVHGRECHVYRFHRGDFYDGLVRIFELAWDAGALGGDSTVTERPPRGTSVVDSADR